MNRTLLAPLLGALVLAGTASAQDTDPPYSQKQRLVVIFSVSEDITEPAYGGAPPHRVLDAGAYRFEAIQDSRQVLNENTVADGTAPFLDGSYTATLQGTISKLYGGGAVAAAGFKLGMRQTEFGGRNIVREGQLGLWFRVALGPATTRSVSFSGDVERRGSHVRGRLTNRFDPQGATISVWHVKLTTEDDALPQHRPLSDYPQDLRVSVANVAGTHPEGDYPAESRRFDLFRDTQTGFGLLNYRTTPGFAMKHEQDYYGDYVSEPDRTQLVHLQDGRVWIQFGWGLSGRYHGWGYTYTVELSATEWADLRTIDASLQVVGKASYAYGDESLNYRVEVPATFSFRNTSGPQPTLPPVSAGLSGSLSSSAGN